MRYAAMVATMICLGLNAAPAGRIRVVNKGIGGDTSRDGLRRFARDVEQLKPDHLILYFGINDALNSGKLVPLAEFTRNMQEMIDRARKTGVKTIILTAPNPIVAKYLRERHPDHPAKDLSKYLDTFDRAVRELAKRNHLPLADLHAAVLAHCPDMESVHSLVRNEANSHSRDGVHLTPEGYRVLAGLYVPLLKGRVKPGDLIVCFGDSITYGAHVKGAGTATGQTYPAQLAGMLNHVEGNRAAPPVK